MKDDAGLMFMNEFCYFCVVGSIWLAGEYTCDTSRLKAKAIGALFQKSVDSELAKTLE